MASTLSAVPGFLVATKGARGIKLVERVRPDNPGSEFVSNRQHPGCFLGPDSRTQPIRGVVGFGNSLLRCPKRHHGEDGAEDFFASNPVTGVNIGKHGGWEPETLGGNLAGSTPSIGALLITAVRDLGDALQLGLGVDGTDISVLVERVTEPQRR